MRSTRRAFLGGVAAIAVAPLLAPAREIAFTAGGFSNFGQGTLAMLHGGETIIPIAEAGCAKLIREIDRLVVALLKVPQEIR